MDVVRWRLLDEHGELLVGRYVFTIGRGLTIASEFVAWVDFAPGPGRFTSRNAQICSTLTVSCCRDNKMGCRD